MASRRKNGAMGAKRKQLEESSDDEESQSGIPIEDDEDDKPLLRFGPSPGDPFALPGIPLYYFHGKTNLYNDIFFDAWDNVFSPTFNIVCPWFNVDSLKSLDRLFELEFEE